MQSHALEAFNSIQDKIGPESCAAVMLFSSLLAIQVLADRFQTQNQSSSEYLDGFLGCLNLLGSVRKVVITDWQPLIRESDLRPLFDIQEHPPNPTISHHNAASSKNFPEPLTSAPPP
jgi:hypothetical protein